MEQRNRVIAVERIGSQKVVRIEAVGSVELALCRASLAAAFEGNHV